MYLTRDSLRSTDFMQEKSFTIFSSALHCEGGSASTDNSHLCPPAAVGWRKESAWPWELRRESSWRLSISSPAPAAVHLAAPREPRPCPFLVPGGPAPQPSHPRRVTPKRGPSAQAGTPGSRQWGGGAGSRGSTPGCERGEDSGGSTRHLGGQPRPPRLSLSPGCPSRDGSTHKRVAG